MPNELLLIESLTQEHETIRESAKRVCCLMDGWEETNWETLEQLQPHETRLINEKHLNLKQSLDFLCEGLKGHYSHEEEEMQLLVGTPLTEAIKIEHGEILKQLEEVNFFLINITPRGFLANGSYLKLIIENLCHLITTHSVKEDTVLQLIKRRFI